MKNYGFLCLYMIIMGGGLVYCNYVLHTTYDSPEFSEKFLPIMIILAVLVLIYGIRNRKDFVIITENKKRYLWFLLLFVPISGLALYSAVKGFDLSMAFFIVFFDSLLIGIAEEGMYRGILLGGLLRKTSPVAAIVVSAVLFSLLHLLNVLGGIELSEVLNQMVSTFLMGLFLGSVYVDSKNILLAILFHFFWDYIMLTGVLGELSMLFVVIFGVTALEVIISAILLFQFRKMPKPILN
ncbi:MAG: lysostaphin resistance A-like protein [Roseburia sp.]